VTRGEAGNLSVQKGARTIQPVHSCKAIGKYAQWSLGLGFGGLLQKAGLVVKDLFKV
jgi:hypothetical protein